MINPLALGAVLTAPLQGFRFSVIFISKIGLPNLLEMRFSKVSGLSQSVKVKTIPSGGHNLYDYRIPDGSIQYGNLVLTRGMPIVSFVRSTFEDAMVNYQFDRTSVFVLLQDEGGLPMAAWQFENAWPVKWSFSDLDASQSSPVVETLELAYDRFAKLL